MCTADGGSFGSVAEALETADAAMDYLNRRAAAGLEAASCGEVLTARPRPPTACCCASSATTSASTAAAGNSFCTPTAPPPPADPADRSSTATHPRHPGGMTRQEANHRA
jgi:hypothetical protein